MTIKQENKCVVFHLFIKSMTADKMFWTTCVNYEQCSFSHIFIFQLYIFIMTFFMIYSWISSFYSCFFLLGCHYFIQLISHFFNFLFLHDFRNSIRNSILLCWLVYNLQKKSFSLNFSRTSNIICCISKSKNLLFYCSFTGILQFKVLFNIQYSWLCFYLFIIDSVFLIM